jgi:hypothetical protein
MSQSRNRQILGLALKSTQAVPRGSTVVERIPDSRCTVCKRMVSNGSKSAKRRQSAGSSSLTVCLFRQEILIDHAALHDDQKILVWVGNYVDTLQRIAVYQKQVGQRAFLHDAELPRLGIDESGEGHQLTIVTSGHLERLSRAVAADHLGEYGALPAGQPRVEQNVGAKSPLDIVLLR